MRPRGWVLERERAVPVAVARSAGLPTPVRLNFPSSKLDGFPQRGFAGSHRVFCRSGSPKSHVVGSTQAATYGCLVAFGTLYIGHGDMVSRRLREDRAGVQKPH